MSETPSAPGPLAGIRVIDLTAVLLGPYATQTLGDLGAEVIKVEAPGGDITRHLGPVRHPGMGGIFLGTNRNKRSIVLDLKRASAQAVLRRLAEGADVLVHSIRPASAARLGIGHAALAAVNPRLVYCVACGFGEGGAYAGRPAYDDMIQGGSGVAALQGMALGEPRYAPTLIADKTVGLMVVNAILAALFARERTGRGQAVEVPMFETMVSYLLVEHLYASQFEPPLGPPGYTRILAPDRRPYPTRDGHICVLPYTDKNWADMFRLAGRADLAADPRFAKVANRSRHIAELYAVLATLFRERTSAEWLAALEAADIPCMPVMGPAELLADRHLAAVGMFETREHPSEGTIRNVRSPMRFSATPASTRRLAPNLGEHGREILAEIGYGAGEIAALEAEGAVPAAPARAAE